MKKILFFHCLGFLAISAAGSRKPERFQEDASTDHILGEMLDAGVQAYRAGNLLVAVRCLRGVVRGGSSQDVRAPRGVMSMHANLFLGNALLKAQQRNKAEFAYRAALGHSEAMGGGGSLPFICRDNLRALRAGREQKQMASNPTAKYLAFRFWAGLSNRRQELLGMIGAARLLNRTLVLPPLVEGRWMANHQYDRPQESVANFYNISTLITYVPVVEERDFVMSIVPELPELSSELHVRDYAYTGQLSHIGIGWGHISVVEPQRVQLPRTPQELLYDFQHTDASVLAIDFSYRFLDFGVQGEFEFFNGTVEWTPPEMKIKFDPPPLYAQVLRSLSYTHRIWSTTESVIKGAGAQSGFLAIHLRRNDMRNWMNRQHAWPSVDQVVQQALAMLKEHGLSAVFLATDADEDERTQLRRMLPGVFEQRGGDGMSEAQVALVDQAMCAHASAFLGNFWSTFTWAILEERYKKGYSSSTSTFMHAPFTGAKKGDVRPCGNHHRPSP